MKTEHVNRLANDVNARDSCEVLIATDVRFWREQLGSQKRMSAILRWLTADNRSVVVFFVGGLVADDAKTLNGLFPDLKVIFSADVSRMTWKDKIQFRNVRGSLSEAIRRWLVTMGIREPSTTLDSFYRPDCKRIFVSLVESLRPSVVLVHYLRLAYLAESNARSHGKWLIDTNDVQSKRWSAFEGSDRSQVLVVSAAQERKALSRFDVVLAIQEADLRVFREEMDLKSVALMMHAERIRDRTPWRRSGKVLLVGSNIVPNIDSAKKLLSTWRRLVGGANNRVTLHILGGVAEALRKEDIPDGVELVGFVPDLEPWYEEAELVLNPVTFGSGLKIKSVEALCHCRPLLTTLVGAEGLPELVATKAFCVVQPQADFVDAAIGLLNDPEQLRQMSIDAGQYARRHFDAPRTYSVLSTALEELHENDPA